MNHEFKVSRYPTTFHSMNRSMKHLINDVLALVAPKVVTRVALRRMVPHDIAVLTLVTEPVICR
jgi:hypothetical protein